MWVKEILDFSVYFFPSRITSVAYKQTHAQIMSSLICSTIKVGRSHPAYQIQLALTAQLNLPTLRIMQAVSTPAANGQPTPNLNIPTPCHTQLST